MSAEGYIFAFMIVGLALVAFVGLRYADTHSREALEARMKEFQRDNERLRVLNALDGNEVSL